MASSSLTLLAAGLAPLLILTATVFSKSNGALPGVTGGIPATAARGGPSPSDSCGKCHSSNPGEQGVATSLTPGQRSVGAGQAIQVTVRVTGGPRGQDGGFAAENTAGVFSPGYGSKTDSSGTFVTHSDEFNRSWTFGYTAPGQAGPVELYTVGVAADGDGSKSEGDEWALHGSDPTATAGTPVSLFVNAASNANNGDGCVGPYGNWPVLGSDQVAATPNPAYSMTVVGAPGASGAFLLVGVALPPPGISLASSGLPDCALYLASPALLGAAVTSGAVNSQRGDGVATFALPLPRLPAGIPIGAQVFIAHNPGDTVAGRTLQATVTNGLVVTTR